MEASIINQFPDEIADTVISHASYHRLLSAYTALPFVTLETITSVRSPAHGELSVAFVRYAPPVRQACRRLSILITAGIHGDAPAGVLALYAYLLSISLRQLPVDIYAFPCVNPVGLLGSSRLSSGHFDLNKQMTRNSIAPEVRGVVTMLEKMAISFDAAFDLQEDTPTASCEVTSSPPQAKGFYLYESNFDPLRPPIGKDITRAVAAAGITVSAQRAIYGEPTVDGVVARGIERGDVFDFERFITMNYTNHVITPRTDRLLSVEDRVRTHTIALESGVRTLQRNIPTATQSPLTKSRPKH
ncbi:MAG: hypothetical protein RL518_694 [Pseudomonadota bacterium]|jgi:hypothetical protein